MYSKDFCHEKLLHHSVSIEGMTFPNEESVGDGHLQGYVLCLY